MADVEAILEKLRSSLKRRGAEGIRGLGRHFKIIDRSGDGLDAEEFAHLCKINRLGLDANEQATSSTGLTRTATARSATRSSCAPCAAGSTRCARRWSARSSMRSTRLAATSAT